MGGVGHQQEAQGAPPTPESPAPSYWLPAQTQSPFSGLSFPSGQDARGFCRPLPRSRLGPRSPPPSRQQSWCLCPCTGRVGQGSRDCAGPAGQPHFQAHCSREQWSGASQTWAGWVRLASLWGVPPRTISRIPCRGPRGPSEALTGRCELCVLRWPPHSATLLSHHLPGAASLARPPASTPGAGARRASCGSGGTKPRRPARGPPWRAPRHPRARGGCRGGLARVRPKASCAVTPPAARAAPGPGPPLPPAERGCGREGRGEPGRGTPRPVLSGPLPVSQQRQGPLQKLGPRVQRCHSLQLGVAQCGRLRPVPLPVPPIPAPRTPGAYRGSCRALGGAAAAHRPVSAGPGGRSGAALLLETPTAATEPGPGVPPRPGPPSEVGTGSGERRAGSARWRRRAGRGAAGGGTRGAPPPWPGPRRLPERGGGPRASASPALPGTPTC